ncbi:MAG: hypothetical protein IJR14_01920 [Synergistaceae bacterium]|nr:hypothetical protein [Synergistaceae bacterium]
MAKKLTIENIQLKRGTAAAWAAKKPVLLAGEVGLEMDTKKFKVGDGTADWTALEYWGGGDTVSAFEAPVGDIVATGDALPATPTEGDMFLNTSDGKLYTAGAGGAWDAGASLGDGARMASSTDKKIYVVSGASATGHALADGTMFFCRQGKKTYVFSSAYNDFIEVGGGGGSVDDVTVIDGGVITE